MNLLSQLDDSLASLDELELFLDPTEVIQEIYYEPAPSKISDDGLVDQLAAYICNARRFDLNQSENK